MTQPDISLLETEFIRNMERARLDRAQNGEYTKKGLEGLVNAAACQFKMYRMTGGAEAMRHKDTAAEILKEAYQQAKKLGIILPDAPAPARETAAPAQPEKPAPAVTVSVKPAPDPDGPDPEEELEKLVGLKQAKETLKKIINTLTYNNMRKERNLPELVTSKHMVFTGHAGTGKTTVARLVAGILRKHGVLSRGHLVEVNANDLVKGYVGHSAEATRKAGAEAIGGILFIDEAYAITKSKYAEEIIPTLLNIMEDNRNDLCVIVAGYADDMTEFVNSNEGIRSRFMNFVHFPDYSAEEMCTIFERMCASKGQKVTPEALEILKPIFEEKRKDPAFGNARGVRNIFEKAIEALAGRMDALKKSGQAISDEEMITFTAEDIRSAASA